MANGEGEIRSEQPSPSAKMSTRIIYESPKIRPGRKSTDLG